MTGDEARHRLRELVRLRQDTERYQRALAAVGCCPELKSTAALQLSHLANQSKQQADAVETELVRLLAGSKAVLWSDPDVGPLPGSDPGQTAPRV